MEPRWGGEPKPKTTPGKGGEHAFRDPSRGERLQRVLATHGVGSRRACEALIEEGVVKVNGHVVSTLPAWVHPVEDHITVKGATIRVKEAPVYVMLFKPRGVICSNDDPGGRSRAVDLVKHPSRARLYPVGRLDVESSGLLLLTNDGAFANALTHPRHGVGKRYEVTVQGALTDEDVARIERGVFLPDRRRGPSRTAATRTKQADLRIVKRDRDRTRFEITLHEGRNRQIRRVLARFGFPVRKLRRIAIGPLQLKGLKPSQWRDLLPDELKALRRASATGEKDSSKTRPGSKSRPKSGRKSPPKDGPPRRRA